MSVPVMQRTPLLIVDHPLVEHSLSALRAEGTTAPQFRAHLRAVARILVYEATRKLPTQDIQIRTPVGPAHGQMIDEERVCLIAVLRAGLGFVDGMLEVIPGALVGHIGLVRDPATLEVTEYAFKVPGNLAQSTVLVLDPMLATGHSAIKAVARLKEHGACSITMISLVCAPEGIAAFSARHPDVTIVTAAVDEKLNDHGYIVPGLGDAGDRLCGTN